MKKDTFLEKLSYFCKIKRKMELEALVHLSISGKGNNCKWENSNLKEDWKCHETKRREKVQL